MVIGNPQRARHQFAAGAQIGDDAELARAAVGQARMRDVDDRIAGGAAERVLKRGDFLNHRQRPRRSKQCGTEIREIGAKIGHGFNVEQLVITANSVCSLSPLGSWVRKKVAS